MNPNLHPPPRTSPNQPPRRHLRLPRRPKPRTLVPPTIPPLTEEATPEPAIAIPDEGADLTDYVLTEADRLLNSVFGDHVHDNDGNQLDGGIEDDKLFQKYWRQLASILPIIYSTPSVESVKAFYLN
jgi:hypothetical protein